MELCGILWAAKKLIIAITLACALAGLGISFLLPQKWTSQAIITPPETAQLIELQRAVVDFSVLEVASNVDSSTFYQLFLKNFDSQVLREEYLSSSPWLKQLLKSTGDVDPQLLHRAIQNASAKFKSVDNRNPKDPEAAPYVSWTLSFTAGEAREARNVLQGYIRFITGRVNQQILQNLRYSLELKIDTEKNKLLLDRAALEKQHQINIQRLEYSLAVANAAGIKKPVYSNGQAVKDDPDYSIALGADGLARKLEIERSLKDAAELDGSIQKRELYLNELQKININSVEFQPYKFQMSPSLPIKKDAPGKALVVVLALLLGLMGACGAVLIRHALASHRQVSQKL